MRVHQGCGRNPGAATQARLPPTGACHHAKAVLDGFLIFQRQTDHQPLKQRDGALFQHTNHLELHTSLPLLVFLLQQSFVSQQSYQGGLGSLKEERNLGMNTIKSSSIVMPSYLQYSSAYELEYSCLVIIMIYELAYNLCVMILTCSTLCIIIHMTCMGRS